MNNIQDNISIQLSFNPYHHKLKRNALINTFKAYEQANWASFTQETIQQLKAFFLEDESLESILDKYLSVWNHIKSNDEWKFLYTLYLLTPTITKISTTNIVERSKNDCRESIYQTLCTYFCVPFQQ